MREVNIKFAYLELRIKNNAIHCNSCESLIQTSLTSEEGIVNVKANHKDQTVKLYYNESKINPDKIRTSLTNLGYPPE